MNCFCFRFSLFNFSVNWYKCSCKSPFALAKNVKAEWLTRENNPEWQVADFPFLPASTDGGSLDLAKLAEIWKNVPGFEPIPVERIGPAGM